MVWIFLFVFFLTLMSCSIESTHKTPSEVSSSSCSIDEGEIFATNVHGFVVSNCASCHASGGVGKTKFADPDVAVATAQFLTMGSVGMQKIANNAASSSHAPGITGPSLEVEVLAIREVYEAQTNSCSQESEGQSFTQLQTAPKAIEANIDEVSTAVFDLQTEFGIASLAGVYFFVDILANDEGAIFISRPRLRTSAHEVVVEGIQLHLNGQLVEFATLFHELNVTVPAWTSEDSFDGTLSLNGVWVEAASLDDQALAVEFENVLSQ